MPDHETDRLFVSELCALARDKLKQQTVLELAGGL